MGKGNDNDRTVQQWEVVKQDHQRASAVTDTQKQAINAARPIVRTAGGGELRIKGVDGKYRDSDTIAPGRESQTKDRR